MSDRQPDPPPALIAEATKRAGVIWITAGGGRPRPAWHVWRQAGDSGAAYVLTGPGEQRDPELAGARRVTVLVPSKDSGGLLVSWQADVSQLSEESPEWREVTGLLAAARLSPAPVPAGTAPSAPARTIYRLTPAP